MKKNPSFKSNVHPNASYSFRFLPYIKCNNKAHYKPQAGFTKP